MKSNLRIVLYNATGHDEEIQGNEINVSKLGKDQLLWIAGDLESLAELSGLPKGVEQGIKDTPGPTNLEIFDECYRFAVPVPGNGNTPLCDVLFVVGKYWLITRSKIRPAFMDRFLDTDKGETLNGRLTASALAAALLLDLLDTYRVAIAEIDKEIDTLDESILSVRETQTPLKKLAGLRRQVSKLRAALGESGSTIHALTRPDFFAHIESGDHVHFETVSRGLDRLDDGIARARETIVGSFDLYTTRVAQETNQLVKALTVVTVITGIVGCAAGVFGMNFDTPFFHTGQIGFFAVTIAMILVALMIFAVALLRKWFL